MKYDLIFRGASRVVVVVETSSFSSSSSPSVITILRQVLSSSSLRHRRQHYYSTTSSKATSTVTTTIEGTIRQNGEGISVGDYAQIKRSYTINEVKQFGQIIGDNNPIHHIFDENNHDRDYDTKQRVIVHGMFTSSLFSSIFGTLIPGSIYRSQQLKFLLPVYTDECIIGKVEVTKVKDLRKGLLVTCDTSVYKCKNDKDETGMVLTKCVKGFAEVWIAKDNTSSTAASTAASTTGRKYVSKKAI